jgi:hypothetical protein
MPEVVCPGCRQRNAVLADLKRRVADLDALVRDLTARLGTNDTNVLWSPTVPPGRTAGLLAFATTSRSCRFGETFVGRM